MVIIFVKLILEDTIPSHVKKSLLILLVYNVYGNITNVVAKYLKGNLSVTSSIKTTE
jgi:hypothetical protein